MFQAYLIIWLEKLGLATTDVPWVMRKEDGGFSCVDIRDWFALEDNVEHRATIHNKEQCHHAPLRPDISLSVLRNSNKHQSDGQLDGDDRSTVKDLEKEEVHQAFGLILLVPWLLEVYLVHSDAIQSCENTRYG